MATTPKIRYDIEAAVSGSGDVNALAAQLEGLANTLEGDLKVQALASAQALRELGAKQGAIDNFVKLKGEAGAAAAKLTEAQAAAQKLGQAMAATSAPTRVQTGQLEKLRDAVRGAKTELQEKTRALDNSRATLRTYLIASDNVAKAELATRQAIAATQAEVAKLAPVYTAAGNAAAAAAQKQTQSAQAVKAGFSGLGDTLRSIQTIALTAVGGTFLSGMARDALGVADEYKNLRSRIQLVVGEGPALASAFEAVKEVALATNTSLGSTVQLFTRVAQAGKEVGLSQEQALEVTETINKAIQSGGGSAVAAEAAILQLIQGMQSGVLRGEEFNSVMENGYPIAQLLARSLGVTTGELRKMAGEGKLTTQVLIGAFREQKDAVSETFEKLPQTVGRALTNLNTQWTAYIGNVDRATGSSVAAANAITAVGNNLDKIVGAAIRAGAGVETAWGVMTAGANGVLTVVFKVGELFASVAGGIQRSIATIASSLSKITFGDLSKSFAEAAADIQLSADATFNSADALNARAKEAFLDMADGAQTAREGWADLTAEVATGASAVESASDAAAASLSKIGTAAQDASKKVLVTAQDTTEAFQAAALAKTGDAQAGEANLRVQLQLAQQSEDMARFMGNETEVRKAKIQQMQIEIQLVQARANVARVEAEGSIAVATAKLAEMKASGEVNLVKQAEIENSIKLAQAKIAEAEATGKSTELMQKQLDAFRNAAAGGAGFGKNLDDLTRSQNRFAGATRDATQALQEQAAAVANKKYSSPLGADKYAGPEGGSVTGSTREERLGGQNAVDNSLIFKLAAKLQAGTFTSADNADALAAIAALDQNEAVNRDLDRFGGAFSTAGSADRAKFQQIRTQLLQQVNKAEVGRRVVLELKTGGQSDDVNTDEEGAQKIVRALQRAGLAAGR